jgi:hypothetical protein
MPTSILNAWARLGTGEYLTERRVGLEQEFFLVDGDGVPSDRADEFLVRCWELTERAKTGPGSYRGRMREGDDRDQHSSGLLR